MNSLRLIYLFCFYVELFHLLLINLTTKEYGGTEYKLLCSLIYEGGKVQLKKSTPTTQIPILQKVGINLTRDASKN